MTFGGWRGGGPLLGKSEVRGGIAQKEGVANKRVGVKMVRSKLNLLE